MESNIVRCFDAACVERMIELIEQIGRQGDSVGGVGAGALKQKG